VNNFDEMSESFNLPKAQPCKTDMFGIDENINVDTIDKYLGVNGVAYRDVRFIIDTAKWEQIGGDQNLSFKIDGFKVIPWPLIGTLQHIPVDGAYDGNSLFTVEWDEDGKVADAYPNYEESEEILDDVFPMDQPIILVCGGGGYAGMTREFLGYMGYDLDKIYNAGAGWNYHGNHRVDLIEYTEDGDPIFKLWRADEIQINLDQLTPIE